MRPVRTLLLVALAVPSLTLAHDPEEHPRMQVHLDSCSSRSANGDRFAREGDVVVEAGDRAGDVIALKGDVIVRDGAVADDVVAVNGDVVVEAGGRVRGSAVSVSGDVKVARKARVDGDAFSLGGEVRVARGGKVAGDTGTLSASWGGTALAAVIADKVSNAEVTCEDVEDTSRDDTFDVEDEDTAAP